MKRKPKISPGQITIFSQIVYAGRVYQNLKDAMIHAMQDFYIRKIYPQKIIANGEAYDFKAMRKYWRMYDLQDVCIY